MGALAGFLIQWGKAFLTWGYNLGIDMLQALLNGFVSFSLVVVSLFPSGSAMPSLPPLPTGSNWTVFINALNWFFPMGLLVNFIAWVSAGLLAYIIIAPLARWVKLLN